MKALQNDLAVWLFITAANLDYLTSRGYLNIISHSNLLPFYMKKKLQKYIFWHDFKNIMYMFMGKKIVYFPVVK